MNMFSLKKLSALSLSIFTLCFIGITNNAQAAVPVIEKAVLRAKGPSRGLSLRDTQALVLSNNTINTFVLQFSAAIRAGGQPNPDPELQKQLVVQLRKFFTREFSITIFSSQNGEITANEFNSLLALVQQLSSNRTFDTALLGNLSLDSITRDARERRSLQIQGLKYIVITPVSGPSVLSPALEQYTIVETRPNVFKIKAYISTAISSPIPFSTPV